MIQHLDSLTVGYTGDLVELWLGRRTRDQQVASLASGRVHCWVSTWMGDRLKADKPSRYVTGHLG